jgi:hypothetical protein
MEDWKDAGDVEELQENNSTQLLNKIICHPRQIQ